MTQQRARSEGPRVNGAASEGGRTVGAGGWDDERPSGGLADASANKNARHQHFRIERRECCLHQGSFTLAVGRDKRPCFRRVGHAAGRPAGLLRPERPDVALVAEGRVGNRRRVLVFLNVSV